MRYVQLSALPLLAAAMLLVAGCSKDEAAAPGHGITVALWSDASLTTRTSLAGTDDVQHVQYVQLYVFRGTGDDAVCVASEDVMWQQPQGGTQAQYYRLEADLEADDYTFLAVGLDSPLAADGTPDMGQAGSAATYGLPAAVQEGTTTKGEAIARLADGKTAADIAQSELMAGSTTAYWDEASDLTVTVGLKRRVAGMMFYLTNIPDGVNNIELVCSTQQYSDVPLFAHGDALSDHGTTQFDSGSEVILSSPVNQDVLAAETITLADGTSLDKQRGSIYMAAYLLPMPEVAVGEGEAMFSLRLTYDDPSVSDVRKVRLDGESDYAFPIQPNWIYRVGHKSSTEDEPQDIGGAPGGDIVVDGNWQASIDIPM